MAIGVSFLGDEEAGDREPDRHQEAIRVLSMRVPKFPRGQVLAPAPLLQGQGGSGVPSAVMQAFARMAGVMPPGGMAPQGSSQGPSIAPQAPRMPPSPRITPGIDPLGAPAPQGEITREWQPPPPAPGLPPMAEPPQTGGYLPPILRDRKRSPWMEGLPI